MGQKQRLQAGASGMVPGFQGIKGYVSWAAFGGLWRNLHLGPEGQWFVLRGLGQLALGSQGVR